nr:insulin-like androgenic gland hormone [Palaemon carinicauda]
MSTCNIGVKKVFFCVLLALCLMQPSSGYTIECLSVDFDCGDIPQTLASVCRVYKPFVPFNQPFITKRRRSVSNSTQLPIECSSPFFHPRATHLTKAKADEGSVMALEMPSEIRDMFISQEKANMMLQSNRRLRRHGQRNTPRDECCAVKDCCTFEEVAEYCVEVRPGALTCERPQDGSSPMVPNCTPAVPES